MRWGGAFLTLFYYLYYRKRGDLSWNSAGFFFSSTSFMTEQPYPNSHMCCPWTTAWAKVTTKSCLWIMPLTSQSPPFSNSESVHEYLTVFYTLPHHFSPPGPMKPFQSLCLKWKWVSFSQFLLLVQKIFSYFRNSLSLTLFYAVSLIIILQGLPGSWKSLSPVHKVRCLSPVF